MPPPRPSIPTAATAVATRLTIDVRIVSPLSSRRPGQLGAGYDAVEPSCFGHNGRNEDEQDREVVDAGYQRGERERRDERDGGADRVEPPVGRDGAAVTGQARVAAHQVDQSGQAQ